MSTAELDLRGHIETTRTLIGFAMDVGWRVTQGPKGKGAVSLHVRTPDVEHHLVIPEGSVRASILSSWWNTVTRYAPDQEKAQRMTLRASGVGNKPNMPEDFPSTLIAYQHGGHDALDMYVPDEEPKPAPSIVSQRPFRAKSSSGPEKGTYYDSEVTIERKWSDGTTDYQCADCDFASPNHRSIAPHRKVHEKAERVTDTYVGPRYEQNSATGRLEAEIELAIQHAWAENDTVAGNARSLAKFIMSKRDEAKPEAEPREPLTPEQVIARIRHLVDGGALFEEKERADALELRLAQAEAMVEEATAKANAELEARTRAEADLDAITEMLNTRKQVQA